MSPRMLILLSETNAVSMPLRIVGCVAIAAAVFFAVRTVLVLLSSEDLEQDAAWRYDVNRINELRKVDLLYRIFQPLIQLFARMNRAAFRDALPEIGREIQASGLPRFWTAEEYLAKLEIIGLLLGPAYLYVCVTLMGWPGSVMAALATGLTVYFLRRRLSARARYRLMQIKRRMPYLLDLLTLLMEAGSTFMQAMRDSVEQFGAHPVGQEFGRVMGEINMGKGRAASFEAMRDRLSDDEITSIVGSILQGEHLGTPLAKIFRTQADVLRMKRTQRAESMAGEAGVKMLLPAVLIMGATVIIILGPFILGFIYADFM